jgi:hypothetical protein
MGVVLTALAVWCALSVLFAGAHGRWVHYAPLRATTGHRGASLDALIGSHGDTAPEGADVSEFFRSYGSAAANATARRSIRLRASLPYTSTTSPS